MPYLSIFCALLELYMIDCHFNSVGNRILPHSEILQLGESFVYMATHFFFFLIGNKDVY